MWKILLFCVLGLGFLPLSSFAASSVDLTVGGSNGPISVNVGDTVNFDVAVNCGAGNSNDLIYVPGTVQPKDGDNESEVEWSIRNDTASTIRINKFGVSWNCINDPGGVCGSWKFDYVKFEEDQPVADPNKIYEDMSPVDNSNSFPLTVFDSNVGDNNPYRNRYLDIAPNQTVQINEMEFVDNTGDKIEPVPSGTEVEFTVTWGDTNGNTYTQTFSVTW
jgi:hypothetical protein